jgi:hypothetical protein
MRVPTSTCTLGEWPRVIRWLSATMVGLALLAMIASESAAASGKAASYSLAYGMELSGRRHRGVLKCNLAQPCKIHSLRSDVVITVTVEPGASWLADIRIYGLRGGCCFFGAGGNYDVVDLRQKLIGIPIFAGRRVRGDEYVRNPRVGTLWLVFSTGFWRSRTDSQRGPI